MNDEAQTKNLEDLMRDTVPAMEFPVKDAFEEKSGKLMLRIPKSIHAQAARLADSEGVSLNQWLSTTVAMVVARASLGNVVVPQDRLEAIAADSFCDHAGCSTDAPKIGVCAACDAIYAARECLANRAALAASANEGTVTWRVELMPHEEWVKGMSYGTEIAARKALDWWHGEDVLAVRLVKIITSETVVETRTRKEQ